MTLTESKTLSKLQNLRKLGLEIKLENDYKLEALADWKNSWFIHSFIIVSN